MKIIGTSQERDYQCYFNELNYVADGFGSFKGRGGVWAMYMFRRFQERYANFEEIPKDYQSHLRKFQRSLRARR